MAAGDGVPATVSCGFRTENNTFAPNVHFPLAFCWNGVGTVMNSYRNGRNCV